MSCQHGRPMGRFAGHNVVCDLFGEPMLPLRIEWYVTVLDLGPWGAVYTQGWDRTVASVGEAAKRTKRAYESTFWDYCRWQECGTLHADEHPRSPGENQHLRRDRHCAQRPGSPWETQPTSGAAMRHARADTCPRHPYFGATIGRYANRIAGGRIRLEGREYQLTTNDEGNHLHGGWRGFDKVIWKAAEVDDRNGPALELRYVSVDGEEGYPGNLSVLTTYTVTEENELRIDYSATTDQVTIVNLTHHSYSNLADGGMTCHPGSPFKD